MLLSQFNGLSTPGRAGSTCEGAQQSCSGSGELPVYKLLPADNVIREPKRKGRASPCYWHLAKGQAGWADEHRSTHSQSVWGKAYAALQHSGAAC